MQTLSFTKMQGAGNDYIYINCMENQIENVSEIAKIVSDRHFGVGSDGLVLICPSDKADFRMDMYNSDGTRAEMCGNASRCVGKYVYDKGLTDKTTIKLETLAGIKTLNLNLNSDGAVDTVCVNMGMPELSPRNIPIDTSLARFIQEPIEAGGKVYKVTGVSMGNPHAVVFVDDTEKTDIAALGPLFENHKLFPKRINTEFVQIIDRKTVKMRVWERGAGETLACGTGACATLAAANLSGCTEDEADVILRGGTLHIRWDKSENNIYMTGAARFVFEGTISVDV